MYIAKISLRHVRCFEEIDIDLTNETGVCKWLVLLGENGVGKTTILRSIAMGLCDATSAAGLVREIYGEWVRVEAGERGESTIEITFDKKDKAGKPFNIITEIKRTPSGYTSVNQKTYPDTFPWEDIFVCGYGSARRGLGTKDFNEYGAIDAVYSLFNYDVSLQNPELIIRRLTQRGINRRKIYGWINKILLLPNGSTVLRYKGLYLRGPWGKFQPLGALGDGYQGTLGWISDLLGWALLYDPEMVKSEISGIVILDEIEQHLHPRWQRQILPLLKDQFPKIQFICTSHSSLTVAGTANFSEEEYKLVSLIYRRGRVEGEIIPSLKGLRADQILTSKAFGLFTTIDEESEKYLVRFRELYLNDKRSKKEDKEFDDLKNYLKKHIPEAAESEEDRLIERKIKGLLEEVKNINLSKDE